MKPLPRENMIWVFLRAHIFMIFGTCFTVSSRIHILSIFYRILSVLGLHFGTLGSTFWGLFFRSQKMQNVFLQCAPGWRPSSTPPGEGGNWEESGRHLGGIWEASGRHLGGTWEAPRRHLGDKGPEEAQRRLGLKKLIDVCSQMQKFLLFDKFMMRF